jgi:hypothetical protein
MQKLVFIASEGGYFIKYHVAGDKNLFLIREGDFILQVTFARKVL